MFSCKHTACRKNIFSARGAYSSCKSKIVEAILEVLDDHIRRGLVRKIRNLVETDQVHAALKSLQHSEKGVSMSLGVIESCKHRVFKTYSALTCEIVLLDQVDDVLDRPRALGRHDTQALRAERIMKTDSQMAFALVKVTLEIRKHSDCREGDPLRTPAESQSAVSISMTLMTFS